MSKIPYSGQEPRGLDGHRIAITFDRKTFDEISAEAAQRGLSFACVVRERCAQVVSAKDRAQ